MSRRSNKSATTRTVSVHLEPDIAQALEQTMISFGLENKSETVIMMMRAFLSAVPENTTVFEVCQQSVREIRKAEFTALAEFYEARARMYRS